jgi:membrane-associated phospholipid phosphatase
VHTFLRTFNLSIVGDYGIHTSVFPSAHVSGAFAAACAIAYLLPRNHLLVSTYFVYAILVAIATVYGRYHYAVDAIAGMVIGILAFPIGVWLMRISRGSPA